MAHAGEKGTLGMVGRISFFNGFGQECILFVNCKIFLSDTFEVEEADNSYQQSA